MCLLEHRKLIAIDSSKNGGIDGRYYYLFDKTC